MMEYANLESVMSWLKDSVDSFNFAMPGETNPTLGEDCAEDVAKAIRARGLSDQKGAVDDWPPNSDNPSRRFPQGYRAWKEEHYGTGLTNFRTSSSDGSMLSVESLKGVPAVSPHQVTMNYGLGRTPSSSDTGYTCADDYRRTDVEKAAYAVEQGRKFYDLTDDTNEPVLQRLGEALHRHLEERNR
jgi:hypothetical protein